MAGMFSRAGFSCRSFHSNSGRLRTLYGSLAKGSKSGTQRKVSLNIRSLSSLTLPNSQQSPCNQGLFRSTLQTRCVALMPPLGAVSSLGGLRLNSTVVGASSDLEAASEGSETSDPLIDHIISGEIPLDTAADILSYASEPSLASLGLGGYSPIGLIQSSLELMHVYGGLPWWGSIVAGTVAFRLLVLPLMIKGQINGAKLNAIRPELERIQGKMKALANTQNEIAKAHTSMEMQRLLKDNDCHPLKSLITPLVQMPLFISFFLALRRMASLPVESMQTGGLFWFPDLTMHDPMFILPVVTGLSMLATIELGAEAGVSNQKQFGMMKNVFRFMSFAMIPLTAKFPTAIFVYWVTSNACSIVQVYVLKQPAVKRAIGLPDIVEVEESTEKSVGFIEGVKSGYKNAVSAAKLRNEEKMKQQRYQAEVDGLQDETYDYNPRLKNNQELFQSADKKGRQRRQKQKRTNQ